MDYLSDSAFVIKRTNFSEADCYVTLFTRTHGKQVVVAKGVRKITSKRAAHLELLCEIKFHAVRTRKNYILADIEKLNNFSRLKQSPRAIGLIFLVCELIDKLCPEDQAHADIFELMEQTLSRITGENESDVLYGFETQMLSYLGFWDVRKKFATVEALENYIETIAERKIKSRVYLKI